MVRHQPERRPSMTGIRKRRQSTPDCGFGRSAFPLRFLPADRVYTARSFAPNPSKVARECTQYSSNIARLVPCKLQ
jgi:hypothetical protein